MEISCAGLMPRKAPQPAAHPHHPLSITCNPSSRSRLSNKAEPQDRKWAFDHFTCLSLGTNLSLLPWMNFAGSMESAILVGFNGLLISFKWLEKTSSFSCREEVRIMRAILVSLKRSFFCGFFLEIWKSFDDLFGNGFETYVSKGFEMGFAVELFNSLSQKKKTEKRKDIVQRLAWDLLTLELESVGRHLLELLAGNRSHKMAIKTGTSQFSMRLSGTFSFTQNHFVTYQRRQVSSTNLWSTWF